MKIDFHCHILPGIDDRAYQPVLAHPERYLYMEMEDYIGLYHMVGSDLHNERYAMFFDKIGFRA